MQFKKEKTFPECEITRKQKTAGCFGGPKNAKHLNPEVQR